MKNLISITFFIFTIQQLMAQTNDINIDMLKAPQSPAANLLGMADSEISKPSDPTTFMVSLRQATNNFSSIPTNYAIDFSPFKVFGSSDLKFTDWLRGRKSFKQNTVLSIAVNNNPVMNQNNEMTPNTALGFGFKMSLLGGDLSKETKKRMGGVTVILNEINNNIVPQLIANSQIEYRDSLSKYCDSDIDEYNESICNTIKLLQKELTRIASEKTYSSKKLLISDKVDSLKTSILKADLNRYGFKWNVEGAIAYNFPQTSFKNNEFSKLGLWTTIGYEFEKGFSIIGLGDIFIVQMKQLAS